MNTPLSKLFRVDNPGQHALIDTQFPSWLSTAPDFGAHEKGENCLCITPIGRDNTCYFGALDIDAKKGTPAIDHKKLQKFIREHKLPLNLFVSKSGRGAHAYLFGKTPVDADSMIASLNLYATLLKPLISEKNEIEIFPKQAELVDDDNGSCIRIPCFGDTTQPVFEGEPKIATLLTVPPCISQVPVSGERNDFMYHLSNFLYLSNVKNVLGLVRIVNATLPSPLPDKEINMVCNSAKRMRNHRKAQGQGWGLGCTNCPSGRKDHCRFSAQQMVTQMEVLIMVEVLYYISSDNMVRVTFEECQSIFTMEDALSYHKIQMAFSINHGKMFLPMKQKDWKVYMLNAVAEAVRIPAINTSDKGYEIIRYIKKISNKFNSGIDQLYMGMPIFVNNDEILIIPADIFNHISKTSEMTVSEDQVQKTIEYLGIPEIIHDTPVYRVKAEKICKSGVDPNFATPIIADIEEKNVSVSESVNDKGNPIAIYKNQYGERIELTNTWLKEHPAIREKVIEISKKTVKSPKISF